jgi:hypothetical protein
MGFVELLESFGGRLGILEVAHGADPQSPPRIQTRMVTLAELGTEIRAEAVRALADQPAELSIPFGQVFERAGIAPHGWTIERLREVLTSEEYRDKPREEVQRRVLEIMEADGVSGEAVVRDAMARDKALDSFEAYAGKKMEERSAAQEHRIAELAEKLKQLQAELAEVNEKRAKDDQMWRDWREQKRTRELDMAWTVSFLIDRPVISISEK